MRKKVLLFLTFLVTSTQTQQTSTIVQDIFGPKGLKLDSSSIALIDQLVKTLSTLSTQDRIDVARQVLPLLHKDRDEIHAYKDLLQAQQRTIPEAVFYKEFLLNQQIAHINNFIHYSPISSTWYESLINYAKKLYQSISSWFASDNSALSTTVVRTAQALHEFITLEREEIVSEYKKTLLYFRLLSTNPHHLPTLMNFWHNQDLQEKIIKRAKKISIVPKVQFVEAIASMFVQGIVLAGGSLATQWEDDTDKKAFDDATAQQSKITTDWQAFQKKLTDDQATIISGIANNFAQAQQKLNQQYDAARNQLQAEILYLNRSINLDQPVTQALDSWVTWDQFFEYSIMATPKPNQWYNIYHYNVGDWEFDASTNSFWQNALVPFPTPPLWEKLKAGGDQKTTSIFNDDPAANSIFTEFNTNKNSYTVEVECTLVNCSYPFFVGIIFNRGRWISGDPERIWQYRLFGLYGTQTNSADPTTRTINAGFAQQILNKQALPTSPLEQIMSNGQTRFYTVPSQDIAALSSNPITYIFTITTQPTTVICTLSKKETSAQGTPQVTQLVSTPINNLDPYLFIFGGIGFMAAGCQASFTIKQPTELVYTQEEIVAFNQAMQAQAKNKAVRVK